jgi:predicted AlkP superfamily pyrophosphatase or phosphodiesterase
MSRRWMSRADIWQSHVPATRSATSMTLFCKRHFTWLSVLSLCIGGTLATRTVSAQQTAKREVILISIDGMTAMDYLHPDGGLKIPNLQALAEQGCKANGMAGIFPTVTYPSHTAMITGQPSSVHGIYTNTPLDPFGRENGGWYYYADKIKSPTLWQLLRKAGLKTAAVSWPVTVGAGIDYLLPEYRPVRSPEDVSLMSALSTPGLFREMIKLDSTDSPMGDAWRTKATIKILDEHHPDLLALHLSDLDAAQHRYGPHTPESHAALEKIDAQIGAIRNAVAASGRAAQTAWVVVSDHGFLRDSLVVNPMVALRDAGLINTNAAGKLVDWKVFIDNEGGSAFLEVRDPKDVVSIAKATEVMRKLAADPANGIAKVYTPEDLKAMHANPTAFLGLEAARGFAIGSDLEGAIVAPSTTLGKHGYNPDIPELRPAMILSGAGVHPCQLREGVRIVDVGPTVAALLGVSMPDVAGRNVNTPIPH